MTSLKGDATTQVSMGFQNTMLIFKDLPPTVYMPLVEQKEGVRTAGYRNAIISGWECQELVTLDRQPGPRPPASVRLRTETATLELSELSPPWERQAPKTSPHFVGSPSRSSLTFAFVTKSELSQKPLSPCRAFCHVK